MEKPDLPSSPDPNVIPPLAKPRVGIFRKCVRIAVASLGLLAADTYRVAHPIGQPVRLSRQSSPSSSGREAPQPDWSMDDLMDNLETVEDVEEFLLRHTAHSGDLGMRDFISTYRQPPECFQHRNWTGPCNTFAEFTAQWAYLHGGAPYIVTLCPEGFSEKWKHTWHQITVCETETGLTIFNNDSVIDHQGSLKEFLAKQYPNMTIAPVGGSIPWRATQPSFRAKLLEHLQGNTEQIPVGPLPRRKAPAPPYPLAFTLPRTILTEA